MEDLVKLKGFGGFVSIPNMHSLVVMICEMTHLFYQLFGTFDKAIGLKWLKMSHMNDSKPDLGERKDRHDHIGEGKIGKKV